MRRRLRDQLPSSGYQVVRNNHVWRDHEFRLTATAAAVAWTEPSLVIDPACGDASIELVLDRIRTVGSFHLGDLSIPQMDEIKRYAEFTGRLETYTGDAVVTLQRMPTADTVILTEILEHVEDPESILAAANRKAQWLVASSPLNEDPGVGNHEHVWSWDKDGYEEMLRQTGWRPVAYQEIGFYEPGWPYTFQVWTCRR